jgi:5-formyltetrahydrofolate cyclo-ligase
MKASLRAMLREQRHAVTESARHGTSQAVCARLLASPEYAAAKVIAAYYAVNGEIDVSPIIESAQMAGKACYLPVLCQDKLEFHRHTPTMTVNRYGIAEPRQVDPISLVAIDLLLLPLLGFDQHGQRLGMGKGYYDKTLATLKQQSPPLLVGVAYDFQCVKQVPVDPWDVPLNAVCTAQCFYRF